MRSDSDDNDDVLVITIASIREGLVSLDLLVKPINRRLLLIVRHKL